MATLDMARYRALFLEEATEHLSEISAALIELEKDPGALESVDRVFRMAHSVKSMAASVGYESIADVAHALEDRMEWFRSVGDVGGPAGLTELFAGLEGLERMVDVVRAEDRSPDAEPELVARLQAVGSRTGRSAPAPRAALPGESSEIRTQPAVADEGPAASSAQMASVRVRTEDLDRFLAVVGEVILSTRQLRTAAVGLEANAALAAGLDQAERRVGELQRRALDLRTTPLQRVLDALPRVARQVSQVCHKGVEVEIVGAGLELDRSILERLSDPLLHLVRNAVDHGIESPAERVAQGKNPRGRLTVAACREKDSIRIEVRDDGAGIDLERVRTRAVEAGLVHPGLADDLPADAIAQLIFRPGLSTAHRVSDISGRGVGMDVVRAAIESLGGTVELWTERGVGTAMTLIVPVTAAVQRVLMVAVGAERVALPMSRVERILELDSAAIERSGAECFALIDGEPLPVIDLADRFAMAPFNDDDCARLVIVALRGERVALRVSCFTGQEEIYLKPVPSLLAGVKPLAGLTLVGDGEPVFLLDPNHLL